jgi:hypothetical protein
VQVRVELLGASELLQSPPFGPFPISREVSQQAAE